MITDFSLQNIILGCTNSDDLNSPECKLLKRIGMGDDMPSYPDFYPDMRYYYQLPEDQNERGPTDYFEYFTLEDFLQHCLDEHGEYPRAIWTA